MNDKTVILAGSEKEMLDVLERLLADDADITARAVARLHPTLKAASSITRNSARSTLLAHFQSRQAEFRRWRSRTTKHSVAQSAEMLASKDLRIQELEATVQALTASHIALLRTVGELGGFTKWAKFYERYASVREKLKSL